MQWLCVSFGAISEVLVAGPSLLGMACNLGDSLPQAIAVALPCAAQRPLEAVASPPPPQPYMLPQISTWLVLWLPLSVCSKVTFFGEASSTVYLK